MPICSSRLSKFLLHNHALLCVSLPPEEIQRGRVRAGDLRAYLGYAFLFQPPFSLMKKHLSHSHVAEALLNVDYVYVAIPAEIPGPWPEPYETHQYAAGEGYFDRSRVLLRVP